MSVPVRSLRLQKRSSKSLDTLSGSSGEIFFDADRNTLRIYTANQAESIILADRVWVTENTFSGNYADLTNTPFIPTDVSELSDSGNILFSGDYNDLTNAPDLGNLNIDITTIDNIGDVDTSTTPPTSGQLLQYDGANWVNATVAGFVDTNTLYDFAAATNVNGGIYLNLTDSDAATDQVEVVGGSGITVALNIGGQVEIQNTASYSINDLSDVNISNPGINNVLAWDGSQWIASASAGGGGGIELTDLSVGPEPAASGDGAIAFDNTTGVFTYTPPDLSAYSTLTAFSVTLGTAQSAGNLSYNNATGVFTFNPANLSGYAQLSDFSVTTNTAAGGGGLSYNNSSGVFTYTPPDLSAAGGGEVIDDLTPQLGGDLDLNTFDIQGAGNISITGSGSFTGAVSAASFSSSATGAPAITSASTITLTAPDGIIVSDGADSLGTISIEKIDNFSNGCFLDFTIPYGNGAAEGLKITGLNNTLTLDVSNGFASEGMIVTDGILGIKAPSIVMDGPVSEPTATGTIISNELAFDVSNTSILDVTSTPAANFAINFTNVPSTTNRAQTYVMKIGPNSFNPTSITINGGSSVTLLWADGVAPSANGSANLYSFTIYSAGGSNPAVFGSMTSYG